MPRLETQVNQIYLIGPETKKISIILYDEKISSRLHLFLLAQLSDIQKKTETQNLKKISEIILTAFRDNKKLATDSLFESALAQINESLAEIAHKGRKSWLGKFSCGILLKCSDQIYLANTGQVSAWLRRGPDLTELLRAEGSNSHPLKTFQNFTQGKLNEKDDLILTDSSMFNFVSFELFKSILKNTPLDQACLKISKILQDSVNQDEGVGAFMLNFGKTAGETSASDYEKDIYAPRPESLEQISEPNKFSFLNFSLVQILSLPKNLFSALGRIFSKVKLPKPKSLKSLSPSAKFFLSSFLVFLVLLTLSLAVSGIRARNAKHALRLEERVNILVTSINETESALIYNNQVQAFEYLKTSQDEFTKLKEIDEETAQTYQQILDDLNNKVNRVSIINNPEVLINFEQSPDLLSRAGSGFVFANSTTQMVQNFDQELKNLFMLNNTNNNIVGLTHVEGLGNYVVTANALYRINGSLSQFDKVQDFPDSNHCNCYRSRKFARPAIFCKRKRRIQSAYLHQCGKSYFV